MYLRSSRYQPDLFIIYTGHNEFLEGQTYSSLMGSPEAIRISAGLASHLRIYSVFRRILHAEEKPIAIDDSTDLSEVQTRLDRSVGPNAYHRDELWQQEIIHQLRKNLETMVALASDCGAQIIFLTPASNLRDFEPFKSENYHDLHGVELKYFRQLVVEANQHYQDGDFEIALQTIDQSLAIDDLHADAQFLRAKILLALGNTKAAREAFTRALEEDVCPLRANEEIIKTIHDVATEHHVPLIDFSENINSLAADQIPGDDWFLDHVHPVIGGHRLLAEMICEKLTQLDIVEPRSNWNEDEFAKIAKQVESQIDPRKHALALRNLAKVLGWAGKNQEAEKLVARAMELLPNDAETHTMAGVAAMRDDRIASAKIHFEKALEIDPANARALIGLGDIMSRNGNHQNALTHFISATQIDPNLVPAWFNMGNSLRQLGQLKDAVTAYQKALELEPNHPDAHKNLRLTLVLQGDLTTAISHYEAAIQLDPDSADRHADLGLVLIDAGKTQQAATEFETALMIDPNSVPALIGTALLSEQAGNLTQAANALRKVLAIDPENTNVRNFLERISN
jgi:tetratricopeptide (TPR) repeat protein